MRHIHEAQYGKTIIQIKQKELLFCIQKYAKKRKNKTFEKGDQAASGISSQYKQQYKFQKLRKIIST